jgi:MFS family permease
MVAESVRPEVRGRAAAALQSGEPVGVAIAAFVGYVVFPRVGWRVVLVASSASAILALVARRSIHLPNERSERPPTWADIRRAHIGRRAVAAWVLGVLKLGTYWSCYLWLPSFLRNEMHQDVGHSLAWMFTAQVGQLVGMLTFGWVSDRIGRRPAFAIYSSITACALLPLAYAWPTLAGSPALFWSAMLTLGFGSGCTAGFGALLAELFPTEVRATAMGAVYNLARAVQVVAPVLVGWAVGVAGLAGGLTVPLVLAVATACWVWVLPETRGIALPTLATSER